MIAIMTNEGALEFGRSISGGSRFLVSQAALLNGEIPSIQLAVNMEHGAVKLAENKIANIPIEYLFPCTGSLPVIVSSTDNGGTSDAMAIDFDFNGQAPINAAGIATDITYRTVIALGRRYYKYPSVTVGVTYHKGDHVWPQITKDIAFVCIADECTYLGGWPGDDPEHWSPVNASDLSAYPGEPDFFADPNEDVIPFFVTSYDSPVTISNGMEWEYKLRVFLDNVATDTIAKLDWFSKGGMESNGSLMLTFLANISEQFRTIREQVTTA